MDSYKTFFLLFIDKNITQSSFMLPQWILMKWNTLFKTFVVCWVANYAFRVLKNGLFSSPIQYLKVG